MTVSPAELARRKTAILAKWIKVRGDARDDVNIFTELAFRNDQDPGSPAFEQQWFHREWQEAWMSRQTTVLHGATGYGKTEQIVAHVIWRLGRDPTLRVLLLGKTPPVKLLRKIKRQIDENKVVRDIFPKLRGGNPWSGERLRVAGAGIDIASDNVSVFGMDGSPQGERADLIIADDILDFENTLTEYQRVKVTGFMDSAVQSRLTTKGQLHVLVNAWHPDDYAFTLGKRPGVWHGVYPAWDPVTETLLWPEFRSREWLENKLATMSETQFARMFLCRPRDESTRIFKSAWIIAARRRGAGLKPLRSVKHRFNSDGQPLVATMGVSLIAAMRAELQVVVGSDLATKKTETARKTDLSANFILGLHSDGSRQVLWLEKGRWSLAEKLERWVSLDRRYKPVSFVIEDNGMQHDLAQYTSEMEGFGGRVECFTTGANKWTADGIEGIGVEMKAGQWITPCAAEGQSDEAYLAKLDPEEREASILIREWEQHLLDFSRVGHTPDDVAASYFAKEGALRLVNGVFSHSHAGEMARPRMEDVFRDQAGHATAARSVEADAEVWEDDEPALELPAHLRHLANSRHMR